jgi:hypothetical protein
MNDALYTTLQVFAKSLGKRQVAEICQRFILDSIPTEIEAPAPPVTKNFKLIKKKILEPEAEVEPLPITNTQAQSQSSINEKLLTPKPISVKKTTPTVVTNRNFKKIAQETNFLPYGTIIITASTDENPTAYGTVVRTPDGSPAIQPAWDKSKFFTGTSRPPIMFLNELNKHFKIIDSKPFNTENAWNDVYKKNANGTNISLSDLWKQTVC